MAAIKNYIIAQLRQIQKSSTKGLFLSFIFCVANCIYLQYMAKRSRGERVSLGGYGGQLEQICL